ncbi:MAG: hypothetical protein QM639_20410 [Rhodocyclaceae bacterium]
MRRAYRIVMSMALFACTASAQAHMVWLESDPAPAGQGLRTRAYFGEWAEGLREKTGGYLDWIKNPVAFADDANKPFAITRGADYLEVAAGSAQDVRLIEAMAPYADKEHGGHTRTVFLARSGRADTQARLDLELIPVSAGGNDFVLRFKGQALAKTKLTVFGPPKWSRELSTDDAGRVTLSTPWAGRYLVELEHIDAAAGKAGDAGYDRTRYVFTLSFLNDKGIAWPWQEDAAP